MKDPYYTEIVMGIESLIHDHDRDSGRKLSDSDVRSSIGRAFSVLKGNPYTATPKKERDRLKGELALALVALHKGEEEGSDIPRDDYEAALHVVEESITTRREMHGHARGYLDFLVGFIADARGL